MGSPREEVESVIRIVLREELESEGGDEDRVLRPRRGEVQEKLSE